ncbi:hypothetical protein X011_26920 [Mycobacterium tuberculosis variant microti OV254]|nr:hypothetical protein X011_26920 [Mycobacterium tuberculosis variant microti OV254]
MDPPQRIIKIPQRKHVIQPRDRLHPMMNNQLVIHIKTRWFPLGRITGQIAMPWE